MALIDTLKQPVGPLPAWGWGVVVVGGYVGYRVIRGGGIGGGANGGAPVADAGGGNADTMGSSTLDNLLQQLIYGLAKLQPGTPPPSGGTGGGTGGSSGGAGGGGGGGATGAGTGGGGTSTSGIISTKTTLQQAAAPLVAPLNLGTKAAPTLTAAAPISGAQLQAAVANPAGPNWISGVTKAGARWVEIIRHSGSGPSSQQVVRRVGPVASIPAYTVTAPPANAPTSQEVIRRPHLDTGVQVGSALNSTSIGQTLADHPTGTTPPLALAHEAIAYVPAVTPIAVSAVPTHIAPVTVKRPPAHAPTSQKVVRRPHVTPPKPKVAPRATPHGAAL